MSRLRVGVVFGGRSGEHEISLVSARSILAALDPAKYDVVEIGIDRAGNWLLDGDPMRQLTAAPPAGPAGPARPVLPRDLASLDVVFPVLHGPCGEDGSVQGLLELAGVPYVGSGIAASALGMDKALMKAAFTAAGLPVAPWAVVLRSDLERAPEEIASRVVARLGLPLFAKPANLGSSVGIGKARTPEEVLPVLQEAAAWDRKIVVEGAINCRELECSVQGNDQPEASVVGEIVPHREFYDYQAKYFDETTELHIPARIPDEVAEEVRRLAIRAFRALDCAGMARVDFLMDRTSHALHVSEVNTIPGFTPISMYPKLWEASGLPYPALLDRLIALALERAADRARNRTALPGPGEAAP